MASTVPNPPEWKPVALKGVDLDQRIMLNALALWAAAVVAKMVEMDARLTAGGL